MSIYPPSCLTRGVLDALGTFPMWVTYKKEGKGRTVADYYLKSIKVFMNYLSVLHPTNPLTHATGNRHKGHEAGR